MKKHRFSTTGRIRFQGVNRFRPQPTPSDPVSLAAEDGEELATESGELLEV